MTHREHTHIFMESVIPLRMRRDFDIARNYLLFVFVASSFPVKVTTANADGIEVTWRTAWWNNREGFRSHLTCSGGSLAFAQRPLCAEIKRGGYEDKQTQTHTHTQTQHTSNGLRECCIPHLIGSEKIQHRAPSKVNFSQWRASQSHGEARSLGPRPPEIGTDNLLLELKQWSHTLTQTTLYTKTHSEQVLLL